MNQTMPSFARHVALVGLLVSTWVTLVHGSVSVCPPAGLGSTSLSMSSFSSVSAVTLVGCEFVGPLVIQDVSNVALELHNCSFHLGSGSIALRGTLQNVNLSVVNAMVTRWWLWNVPPGTTDADAAANSIVDTATSPALVNLDGLTTGLLILNNVQLLLYNASWTAKNYNVSVWSETGSTLPELLTVYVSGDVLWNTQAAASSLSSPWSVYLIRSIGQVQATDCSVAVERLVATALVGCLPSDMSANFALRTLSTLATSPHTLAALARQSNGLPVVWNAAVIHFRDQTTIVRCVVEVRDSWIDFGGVPSRDASDSAGEWNNRTCSSGVVPGGNASLIRIAPSGALSSSFLRDSSFFVANVAFTAAAVVVTAHPHIPTPRSPNRPPALLPLNGSSATVTLTSSTSFRLPLLQGLLGVVQIVGSGGSSGTSGAKVTVSVASSVVTFSTVVDEMALRQNAVFLSSSPVLFNSSGIDTVASVLMVYNIGAASWDTMAFGMFDSTVEFRGFDLSTQLAIAQWLNSSSNGSVTSPFAGKVAPHNTLPAASHVNGATAVSAFASFYGSVWNAAAVGSSSGLQNAAVMVNRTAVICRVGCQSVNLTVIEVHNPDIGRLVPVEPTSAHLTTVVNFSATFASSNLTTDAAVGSLSLSSYSARPTQVRHLVCAHRLVRSSPMLSHANSPSSALKSTFVVWEAVVDLMRPIPDSLSNAPPEGDVLDDEAFVSMVFPPDGTHGGPRFRGTSTRWPAVVEATTYVATRVSWLVSSCVFRRCGWGADCFRFDTGLVPVAAPTPQVRDLSLQIDKSTTLTCYGWQTSCLVVLSQASHQVDGTRIIVQLTDVNMTHWFVAPLSGARSATIGALNLPTLPQGLTVVGTRVTVSTWMECATTQAALVEYLATTTTTASASPPLDAQLPARFTTSAFAFTNQSLQGVVSEFPSSVVLRECAFRVGLRTVASWALTDFSNRSLGVFYSMVNSSDTTGRSAATTSLGLQLAYVPETRHMMATALLLTNTSLGTSMVLNITNCALYSVGVGIEVDRSSSSASGALVSVASSTISVVAVGLRTCAGLLSEDPWYATNLSLWNTTSHWSRAAALLLLANSSSSTRFVLSATNATVEVGWTSDLLLFFTPAMCTTESSCSCPSHRRCDVSFFTTLSAIVLRGEWASTFLVIANSSVLRVVRPSASAVVSLRGITPQTSSSSHSDNTASPLPPLWITRAFGIRTWGSQELHPFRGNDENRVNVTQPTRQAVTPTFTANHSGILVTGSSTLWVESHFGPATVFYIADARLDDTFIRSNVFDVFPNVYRNVSLSVGVFTLQYVSWFPATTTLFAGAYAALPEWRRNNDTPFPESTWACPSVVHAAASSTVQRVVAMQKRQSCSARLVWFDDGAVITSLLVNFTDTNATAVATWTSAAMAPVSNVLLDDAATLAAQNTTVSVPVLLVVALVQTRVASAIFLEGSAAVLPLASLSNETPTASVLAANITFIVGLRGVTIARCGIQPLPVTLPASAVANSGCGSDEYDGGASLSELRCGATNVWFGPNVDAAMVNVTFGWNTTVVAEVTTVLPNVTQVLDALTPVGGTSSAITNGSVALAAMLGMNITGAEDRSRCTTDDMLPWYAPGEALRRQQRLLLLRAQGNASAVCPGTQLPSAVSELDFAVVSIAANVATSPSFNRTASSTIPPLMAIMSLLLAAGNANPSDAARVDREIVLMQPQARVVARSATITEAASAINVLLRPPAAGRRWQLEANAATIAAHVALIPVIRINMTSTEAIAEEASCVRRIQQQMWELHNFSTSSTSGDDAGIAANLSCVPRAGSASEESVAANMHLQDAIVGTLNVSWINCNVYAAVTPLFYQPVQVMLASSATYFPLQPTSSDPMLSAPVRNATYAFSRSVPRHARNFFASGDWRIGAWLNFAVLPANGELLAHVATGIDGSADNVALTGNGTFGNASSPVFTTRWTSASLGPTLVSISSARSVPISRVATNCFYPPYHHLIGHNIAVVDSVSSSYQTLSIAGLSLICRGSCANVELGKHQAACSTPYSSLAEAEQRSGWVGAIIALSAVSFESITPPAVYVGPIAVPVELASTTSSVALTATLNASLAVPLPSQVLQASSPVNILLRSLGPIVTVSVDALSLKSSGWNVAVHEANWSQTLLLVTSRSSIQSGPWISPSLCTSLGESAVVGTSYASLGRDVVSLTPVVPRCPASGMFGRYDPPLLSPACTGLDTVGSSLSNPHLGPAAVGNVVVAYTDCTAGSRISVTSAPSTDDDNALMSVDWSLITSLFPSGGATENVTSLALDAVNVRLVNSTVRDASSVLIGDAAGAQTSSTPNAITVNLTSPWLSAAAAVTASLRSANVWAEGCTVEQSATVQLKAPRMILSAHVHLVQPESIGRAVAGNLIVENCSWFDNNAAARLASFGLTTADVMTQSSAFLSHNGNFQPAQDFLSGLLVRGVHAMTASTTSNGNATNILLRNAVFRNALVHVSASILLNANGNIPSSSQATMLSSNDLATSDASVVVNVVVSGTTDWTASVLQLEGFLDVSTSSSSPAGLLRSCLQQNITSAALLVPQPRGASSVSDLSVPSGVNFVFGPMVVVQSFRLILTKTALRSLCTNILSFAQSTSHTDSVRVNATWTISIRKGGSLQVGNSSTVSASAEVPWVVPPQDDVLVFNMLFLSSVLPAVASVSGALSPPLLNSSAEEAWDASRTAPYSTADRLALYVEEGSRVESSPTALLFAAARRLNGGGDVVCGNIAFRSADHRVAGLMRWRDAFARRIPCAPARNVTIWINASSMVSTACVGANTSAANIDFNPLGELLGIQPDDQAAYLETAGYRNATLYKRVCGWEAKNYSASTLSVSVVDGGVMSATGPAALWSSSTSSSTNGNVTRQVSNLVSRHLFAPGEERGVSILVQSGSVVNATWAMSALNVVLEELPLQASLWNYASAALPPRQVDGNVSRSEGNFTVVVVVAGRSSLAAAGARHARNVLLVSYNRTAVFSASSAAPSLLALASLQVSDASTVSAQVATPAHFSSSSITNVAVDTGRWCATPRSLQPLSLPQTNFSSSFSVEFQGGEPIPVANASLGFGLTVRVAASSVLSSTLAYQSTEDPLAPHLLQNGVLRTTHFSWLVSSTPASGGSSRGGAVSFALSVGVAAQGGSGIEVATTHRAMLVVRNSSEGPPFGTCANSGSSSSSATGVAEMVGLLPRSTTQLISTVHILQSDYVLGARQSVSPSSPLNGAMIPSPLVSREVSASVVVDGRSYVQIGATVALTSNASAVLTNSAGGGGGGTSLARSATLVSLFHSSTVWSPAADLNVTAPTASLLGAESDRTQSPLLLSNWSTMQNTETVDICVKGSSSLAILLNSSSSLSTPASVTALAYVTLWRASPVILPSEALFWDAAAVSSRITKFLNAPSNAPCPPSRGLFVIPSVLLAAEVSLADGSMLQVREVVPLGPSTSAFTRVEVYILSARGSPIIRGAASDDWNASEYVSWGSLVPPATPVWRPLFGPLANAVVSPARGLLFGNRSSSSGVTEVGLSSHSLRRGWTVSLNRSTVAVALQSTAPPITGAHFPTVTHSPSTVGLLCIVDVPFVVNVSFTAVQSIVTAEANDPFPDWGSAPTPAELATTVRRAVIAVSRVVSIRNIAILLENTTVRSSSFSFSLCAVDDADDVANVTVALLRGTRVSGLFDSVYSMRRLTSATTAAVSNVTVVVHDQSAVTWVTGAVIGLPDRSAVITNARLNITQARVDVLPFVLDRVAVFSPLPHPLQSPAVPLSGASLRFATVDVALDGATLADISLVFSPPSIAAITASGVSRATMNVSLAGVSLVIGQHVGDLTAAYLGLPSAQQAILLTRYPVSLWSGENVTLYGHGPFTESRTQSRSLSNDMSTSKDSLTVAVSGSSSETKTATAPSRSASASSHPSLTHSSSASASHSLSTSATPPAVPCPPIFFVTQPSPLLDTDIASSDVLKVLYLVMQVPQRGGGSSGSPATSPATPVPSNNASNTSASSSSGWMRRLLQLPPGVAVVRPQISWSRDLGLFMDFYQVPDNTVRSEPTGFTATLQDPLNNVSHGANLWSATDDTFLTMQLHIPTVSQYRIIVAETITAAIKFDGVHGGCHPAGASSRAGPGSVVMTTSFTIYPSTGTAFMAAAAVVAVVSSAVSLVVGIGGRLGTYIILYELQVLALLGTMSCALQDQIVFSSYAVYLLSPFAKVSPSWMAIGGVLVVVGCWLAPWGVVVTLVSTRPGTSASRTRARCHFPGAPLNIAWLFTCGIVSGAFQAAQGSTRHEASTGAALLGILFSLVVLALVGNTVLRLSTKTLDFRPYPPQAAEVQALLKRQCFVRWTFPVGTWRSGYAPFNYHNAYVDLLGAYRGNCRPVVVMCLTQTVLTAAVSGYRFQTDQCYVPYVMLALIHTAGVCVLVAVRPYRAPILNAAVIAGQVGLLTVLCVNIAYAVHPSVEFSRTQSAAQLALAAVAIVKSGLCAWFSYADAFIFQPPKLGKRDISLDIPVSQMSKEQLVREALAKDDSTLAQGHLSVDVSAIPTAVGRNSDFSDDGDDDDFVEPTLNAVTRQLTSANATALVEPRQISRPESNKGSEDDDDDDPFADDADATTRRRPSFVGVGSANARLPAGSAGTSVRNVPAVDVEDDDDL